MSRRRTDLRIREAATPILKDGETVVGTAAVWMADRRARVPLLFTGRAIYLLALTRERVLVFDTPRRGRPLLEADLLLARPFGAVTLSAYRRTRPMAQLRMRPTPEREIVLEFRPRDRRLARRLATAIREAEPASPVLD